MTENELLKPDDKIVFDYDKTQKTYLVKQIAIKDFSNPIWRSGFIYGVMSGGALILIIIAAIITPFLG